MVNRFVFLLALAWGMSLTGLAEELGIVADSSCSYFNQILERLEEMNKECGLDQVERVEECLERGAKFVMENLAQAYVCFDSEGFYKLFHLVSGIRDETQCVLFYTVKEAGRRLQVNKKLVESEKGEVLVKEKKVRIFGNECSVKSSEIGKEVGGYLEGMMSFSEFKKIVVKWVVFVNGDGLILSGDIGSKRILENEKQQKKNEYEKKQKKFENENQKKKHEKDLEESYDPYEVIYCMIETSIDYSPFIPVKYFSKDNIKIIRKFIFGSDKMNVYNCAKYGEKLLGVFESLMNKHTYDAFFKKIDWLKYIPDLSSFWRSEDKVDTTESVTKDEIKYTEYIKNTLDSAKEGIKDTFQSGKENLKKTFDSATEGLKDTFQSGKDKFTNLFT